MPDKEKIISLARAAQAGDGLALLLDRGADLNKSGAPWATPLAWTRKKCYADIESDLRQAGAQ